MPNTSRFPIYRLVAQFADYSRLTFDGDTEEEAMEKMELAMEEHGDISWYDGVTDVNYTDGLYHRYVMETYLPPVEALLNALDKYKHNKNLE